MALQLGEHFGARRDVSPVGFSSDQIINPLTRTIIYIRAEVQD